MVDSAPVPGPDFWLDWSLAAPVDELRKLLPRLADDAGYRVDEQITANSAPGWAMLRLWSPDHASGDSQSAPKMAAAHCIGIRMANMRSVRR